MHPPPPTWGQRCFKEDCTGFRDRPAGSLTPLASLPRAGKVPQPAPPPAWLPSLVQEALAPPPTHSAALTLGAPAVAAPSPLRGRAEGPLTVVGAPSPRPQLRPSQLSCAPCSCTPTAWGSGPHPAVLTAPSPPTQAQPLPRTRPQGPWCWLLPRTNRAQDIMGRGSPGWTAGPVLMVNKFCSHFQRRLPVSDPEALSFHQKEARERSWRQEKT